MLPFVCAVCCCLSACLLRCRFACVHEPVACCRSALTPPGAGQPAALGGRSFVGSQHSLHGASLETLWGTTAADVLLTKPSLLTSCKRPVARQELKNCHCQRMSRSSLAKLRASDAGGLPGLLMLLCHSSWVHMWKQLCCGPPVDPTSVGANSSWCTVHLRGVASAQHGCQLMF